MPKSRRNIHVVPHGERWAIIRDGTRGPFAFHLNRQDAANHARKLARRDHVEMLVFDHESQVRHREDYRELVIVKGDGTPESWPD
jgi:hypothetical protein